MIRKLNRTRRGATTIELIVASCILALILTIGINALVTGLKTLDQGLRSAQMEQKAQFAMRRIVNRIREAAAVSVDNDGMGMTFYLPAQNNDGTYSSPIVPSATANRFYYYNGKIYEKMGDASSVVRVDNAMNSDPNTTGSYKMFTVATSGGNTEVTVCYAARRSTSTGYTTARLRETILLRNVPAVTQ